VRPARPAAALGGTTTHRRFRADNPRNLLRNRIATSAQLARPGVETPIHMGPAGEAWLPLGSRAAADMFDLAAWETRLDAAEAVWPSCPAAVLEERRRAWCLLGAPQPNRAAFDRAAALLSARAFAADPARLLDDAHPRHLPFRRREESEFTYFRRGGDWMRVEAGARHPVAVAVTSSDFEEDWRPAGDAWRANLLLPPEAYDANAAADAVAEELRARGEHVSERLVEELTSMTAAFPRGASTSPLLHHHEVLGADFRRLAS
jgi:hypothetical protein